MKIINKKIVYSLVLGLLMVLWMIIEWYFSLFVIRPGYIGYLDDFLSGLEILGASVMFIFTAILAPDRVWQAMHQAGIFYYLIYVSNFIFYFFLPFTILTFKQVIREKPLKIWKVLFTGFFVLFYLLIFMLPILVPYFD